jgi:hypothetical protein
MIMMTTMAAALMADGAMTMTMVWAVVTVSEKARLAGTAQLSAAQPLTQAS